MSSTDESISKHRSKHNTSRLSAPVASTPVKIKFSGKVPGKKLYPLGIPDHFSNVILSTCFYCSPVENCQDWSPVKIMKSLGRDVFCHCTTITQLWYPRTSRGLLLSLPNTLSVWRDTELPPGEARSQTWPWDVEKLGVSWPKKIIMEGGKLAS